jgi:glycosyltransferase involved in cell wall biosynthesis
LLWDGAACGRIRILQPAEQLKLHGHDVTTSVDWESGKENILSSKILVGQRLSRLEGAELWRSLKPGRQLVYELDDDFWHIDPSNLGAYLRHGVTHQFAMETIIEQSDLVTVSTYPLAEVVRPHNSNVRVLPNCIDGRILDMVRPRHPDKIVIGWAGGDSHVRDLALVIPTLRRLLNQNRNVEFHTIGADFLTLFKVPGRHTPWQEDLFDLYRAMDFDIAIAPLTNTIFNQSKSGIKAMEAMALGIPVVASDVEPYRGVVKDGITGFLVRERHKWMGKLRELINDPDLRERMGQAGKRAAGKMTIQTGWKGWEDAYASLFTKSESGVV